MKHLCLLLLAFGLAAPAAHGSIKSWCRACVCNTCGYSTTEGDKSYPPSGSYPAGGDCGCSEYLRQCSSFGICKTYTNDPNAASDCPYELNATCCTGAYDCGGYCQSYSSPSGTLSTPLNMWQPDNKPTYSSVLPPQPMVAQTPDVRDLVRVDAAKNPWITSATLIPDVSALSEDVGLALTAKRKQLAAKIGWNQTSRILENGAFISPNGAHVHYQIQRNGAKWVFWVAREQHARQQLWQVPASDRLTLTIDGKTWKLKQGDLDLGSGTL